MFDILITSNRLKIVKAAVKADVAAKLHPQHQSAILCLLKTL
jgi:hypothetical protein